MTENKDCFDIIHDCFVFHSRDWSTSKRDEILYCIIIGYEGESEQECFDEMKEKFNCSDEHIQRLKTWRKEFLEAKKLFRERREKK